LKPEKGTEKLSHLIPDIAPCSLLRHTKNRSITSKVANKARLPQWYVAIMKKWPLNISAKYWVDEKLYPSFKIRVHTLQ